jgi:hypothetical protein
VSTVIASLEPHRGYLNKVAVRVKSPSDRFLNYNNSSRTVALGADPHLLKEMRSLYGRQPEIALAFVVLFACNPSRVDAERGDHFLACPVEA